ncbi:MAG: invasion associated locus B family protein [Xanthobacteraceae bacterium]|nr:invasion associated locus B family protein [Xanthobacteraceae bacterium]
MQRSPRTIMVLCAAVAVSTAALAEQSKQGGGQKSAAAAAGAQPTLLGQYGDWGAYTASPDGRKVCFTLAKPKSSSTSPAGRKRDPAFVFISTRPAENVRNEISVVVGYPFKGDATAEVGPTKFAMYTQNDGAWIKNVAEEARLIDAMRKGADLTIKGTSTRGTSSTDMYSLKGLAQAMDRVAQECK